MKITYFFEDELFLKNIYFFFFSCKSYYLKTTVLLRYSRKCTSTKSRLQVSNIELNFQFKSNVDCIFRSDKFDEKID